MRIVGYIEHPDMKITVFRMDNKISLKFETGLYEQTFKFRETEELSTMEQIEKLVTGEFAQRVLENFGKMHTMKNDALFEFLPKTRRDEFEEII
ncbi:MAG: hypothetical protein AAF573_16350 [Bacteroidota bacterium]